MDKELRRFQTRSVGESESVLYEVSVPLGTHSDPNPNSEKVVHRQRKVLPHEHDHQWWGREWIGQRMDRWICSCSIWPEEANAVGWQAKEAGTQGLTHWSSADEENIIILIIIRLSLLKIILRERSKNMRNELRRHSLQEQTKQAIEGDQTFSLDLMKQQNIISN